MNLSDQQIHGFIEAWRRDFGETLSFEVAKTEATRLLTFFMQMEEGLGSQQATANKSNSLPDDHGDLKAVWQKTMRKGHV